MYLPLEALWSSRAPRFSSFCSSSSINSPNNKQLIACVNGPILSYACDFYKKPPAFVTAASELYAISKQYPTITDVYGITELSK